MSQVVLITGSSTGFGRVGAETLARRGHTVFASMRDIGGKNSEHRRGLEQLASAEKLPLHVLELDVTNDASVDAAVQQVIAKAGRIDVLINNAGFACMGVTEAFTPDDFKLLFETNFFGVVRVTRAVLPHMRTRRSGLVVHVSSVAGRFTSPYMAPYCSSKHALESLAEAYRFELTPFGIDTVLIEPGAYPTAIFGKTLTPSDRERAASYGAEDYSYKVVEGFQQLLSSPEVGSNDEIAKVFVDLIEMPAGQRPARVPLGNEAGQLLTPYNAFYEQMHAALALGFGMDELVPKQAASSTAKA